MQKLAGLLRSPRRLAGMVIVWVGVVLLIASIASALHGSPPIPEATSSPPEDTAAAVASAAQTASGSPPDSSAETPKPSSNPQTKTNTPEPANQNPQNTEPTPESNQNTLKITLKINGQTAGEVTVQAGGNHCDVLTAARDQGIIQSVDMRWYEQYGSYFVEKINGIGGNWTYKVNGTSPLGCSGVQAHNGDTVHWEN